MFKPGDAVAKSYEDATGVVTGATITYEVRREDGTTTTESSEKLVRL